MVALKGVALHALKIYLPGERPMADIDLLVRSCDGEAAASCWDLGTSKSLAIWKIAASNPFPAGRGGLGEHRDTPITIELHTRIQERLPVSSRGHYPAYLSGPSHYLA